MQALLRRRLSQEMQFPPLFAIIADEGAAGRSRATIYQSILVRDGPDRWGESPSIYYVSPYRIFHGARDRQYPDEVFLLTALRRTNMPRHDVMLIADLPDSQSDSAFLLSGRPPVRQLFYHGRWELTGQTVFSLFCATPIPVLELPSTATHSGRIRWPAPSYNRLPIVPVENDFVRIWQRRWELPVVSDEMGGGAATRVIPVPAPPSPSPSMPPTGPSAIATELPSFVANAIVADAIARGLQCPITMESIAEITAPVAVTNCYHVFESAALTGWMRTGDGTCPTCKTRI